jgi:TonB family protein
MSMRVTTALIFVIAANTIAIGQDAPVRAGAPGVSHPHLQQTIVPVYPPLAVAARVSGTVLIEAIIDQTGRVTSATIVKSIPLLDAAALESVRKWRFEPPRLGGREVRFATSVTFDFQLFDVAAPRPLVTQAYDSGMPADFAVVYDSVTAPRSVTLMPPRDDLAEVFRELSEAGLLSRTDGLHTWNEIGAAEIRVSDRGVSVAVAGVSPQVDVQSSHSAAVYKLFVRSDGVWRRLWPPFNQRANSVDYQKKLATALALIQRIVAGK